MKAVTEFPNFVLAKGLTAKAALASEGKTPEEIQTSIGESFKFEAEKVKHFLAAIDVSAQNTKDLRRVLVVSIGENETAPAKAVKVEEHYYVPEFLVMSAPKPADSKDGKGGRGGKGKGKGGPKSSPWGMSPEEKAAKNNKGAAKA
jgi:hypothetical protein